MNQSMNLMKDYIKIEIIIDKEFKNVIWIFWIEITWFDERFQRLINYWKLSIKSKNDQ